MKALQVLLYVVVAYVLLSLESPLLTSFHVRMYAPDVALAVVVHAACAVEFLPGVILCAVLGLLKDGFSSGVPVGTHVEIYVLVFLCCFALTRRLDYRNVVLLTLVTFGASLVSSFLFFVFSAIFDRDFEEFDLVFRLALPQALITSPMGPIVAGLLAFLDRKLAGTEKDGVFR